MNEIDALNRDTPFGRALKFVIWTIGFIIVRLLLNNTIGMFLDKESVVASTQTTIPKVGSTVSALCGDTPFLGFLIRMGDFAMNFVYPVAMAASLIYLGWKIAAWAPLVGYGAAAFVYYSIGPQSISGSNVGLNGLPMYVLIPTIGFILSAAAQLLYNKLVKGKWIWVGVLPCIDPNKPKNGEAA